MRRRPRLHDVVEWSRPRPRGAGQTAASGLKSAAKVVGLVVIAAVELVADGGGWAFEGDHYLSRARTPADPTMWIQCLDCTVVSGTAPWMPAQWADRPMLRMSATRAWVEPPGVNMQIDLDVMRFRLVELRAAGGRRARGRRAIPRVDTRCEAEIAGPGAEVLVRGSWLAIAWLAHLGGWPDPARNG
jgi:hypothetical protein